MTNWHVGKNLSTVPQPQALRRSQLHLPLGESEVVISLAEQSTAKAGDDFPFCVVVVVADVSVESVERLSGWLLAAARNLLQLQVLFPD